MKQIFLFFFAKCVLELKKSRCLGDWYIISTVLHTDPLHQQWVEFFPLAACYQTWFVCFTIRCFAQNVEIIAAWIASGVNNIGFDGICWKWVVFWFFFKPFRVQTECFVPDAVVGTIYKVFIKFPLAGNATGRETLHHDICKRGNVLFQKAMDASHMLATRCFISMHCCQTFPLKANQFY